MFTALPPWHHDWRLACLFVLYDTRNVAFEDGTTRRMDDVQKRKAGRKDQTCTSSDTMCTYTIESNEISSNDPPTCQNTLNVTIQIVDPGTPGKLSEAAAPQIRNPARAPSLLIASPIRDTPPCRSTVEGRDHEEDNRAVLHPWLQGECSLPFFRTRTPSATSCSRSQAGFGSRRACRLREVSRNAEERG